VPPALIAVLVVVLVAASFLLQRYRRVQAARTAETLGGSLATRSAATRSAPQAAPSASIGAPNPAVPPPASPPDQLRGVVVDGAAVRLQVCGLPALAWQRSEHDQNSYQGMRLSLIVDAGVALPVLQLFHRAGFLQPFADQHGPSGLGELDERFRSSGELGAWAPVLAAPQVQQALLAFPLDTVSVLGGRLTFVSLEGVHLDPDSTQGLAQVAAALISAVPQTITGAAATPPAGAAVGTDATDADAIVANVLANSKLSPQEQQAVMALIRANQQSR
jgi:hypothetical protein